jgi:hypothetical protein
MASYVIKVLFYCPISAFLDAVVVTGGSCKPVLGARSFRSSRTVAEANDKQ